MSRRKGEPGGFGAIKKPVIRKISVNIPIPYLRTEAYDVECGEKNAEGEFVCQSNTRIKAFVICRRP